MEILFPFLSIDPHLFRRRQIKLPSSQETTELETNCERENQLKIFILEVSEVKRERERTGA